MRNVILAMSVALGVLVASGDDSRPKSLPPDVGAGRIAWFDITTTNLDKSKEFYAKLFGWTYGAVEGTDQAAEILSGDLAIGTIRTERAQPGTANGVVYVQVSDIQDSCRKAKSLGGTVPEGFPFNLPGGIGAIALVVDPVGHPIGLYSRKPIPN
jgi:predicted enzyme related to lactoylglutathione lyase